MVEGLVKLVRGPGQPVGRGAGPSQLQPATMR